MVHYFQNKSYACLWSGANPPNSFWAQIYFCLAVIHLFVTAYLSKSLNLSEKLSKMIKIQYTDPKLVSPQPGHVRPSWNLQGAFLELRTPGRPPWTPGRPLSPWPAPLDLWPAPEPLAGPCTHETMRGSPGLTGDSARCPGTACDSRTAFYCRSRPS